MITTINGKLSGLNYKVMQLMNGKHSGVRVYTSRNRSLEWAELMNNHCEKFGLETFYYVKYINPYRRPHV